AVVAGIFMDEDDRRSGADRFDVELDPVGCGNFRHWVFRMRLSAMQLRLRGDERLVKPYRARKPRESLLESQPFMIAFAALPTASTRSPASRKATMRQGQPSRP